MARRLATRNPLAPSYSPPLEWDLEMNFVLPSAPPIREVVQSTNYNRPPIHPTSRGAYLAPVHGATHPWEGTRG